MIEEHYLAALAQRVVLMKFLEATEMNMDASVLLVKHGVNLLL
mgnify:CR=1 FL=1